MQALLVDTWWYGLTARWTDSQMISLAEQRRDEGFNAIQLVAGIPPEIGPAHPAAGSVSGAAWELDGEINTEYLIAAERRIAKLNDLGFTVIVYGAWGYQIDWMGAAFMCRWWSKVIDHLGHLDVIWCITGESNLWILRGHCLLPNRTTDDLAATGEIPGPHDPFIRRARRRIHNQIDKLRQPRPRQRRCDAWSTVLAHVAKRTRRPILIHTVGGDLSHDIVSCPEHLAAVTYQTGHSKATHSKLWQLPTSLRKRFPNQPIINLEPWYEGIRNDFGTEDQIYAYWVSMLAGTASWCYGAHGIWNLGDGKFLSHWGKQSLADARHINTPALLGRSHEFLSRTCGARRGPPRIQVDERKGYLQSITCRFPDNVRVTYYVDASIYDGQETDSFFIPMLGRTSPLAPTSGQLVTVTFRPDAGC